MNTVLDVLLKAARTPPLLVLHDDPCETFRHGFTSGILDRFWAALQ